MLAGLIRGIVLLKKNLETSCVSNPANPREKIKSHAKKETCLEIHEKSKQKLKESIRRIFWRTPTRSIENANQQLAQKLQAWINYFLISRLQNLELKIRHANTETYQTALWKTWKKVKTRAMPYETGGKSCPSLLQGSPGNCQWWISNNNILKTTLTRDFLKHRGSLWLRNFTG